MTLQDSIDLRKSYRGRREHRTPAYVYAVKCDCLDRRSAKTFEHTYNVIAFFESDVRRAIEMRSSVFEILSIERVGEVTP